ncbi:MAG: glyceraldehyde 3-phosphate dehydrogenase [Candidatus Endobugula sp.]|jgi:glyceraldehyde 3-phosphate dehydrogenase
MTIKVAINGFGRIGRNILRALYESNQHQSIKIVAINDLGSADINAHLLKFDSVHGQFSPKVTHSDSHIFINEDPIAIFSEISPENLPWKNLDIDVVYECTGRFNNREQAGKHIIAGAKRVIISAPANDADATIVYGINHQILTKEHVIISNASCTTNCLAPIAKPLNDALGIEQGLMTTIHSYTNDQKLSDTYHSDLYRARSATQSMIPTQTGAAGAVGLVLPELNGKLDGMSVRVPTINVSLVDFTFYTNKKTSVEEVNAIIQMASKESPNGILQCNALPLVSIDYNHNPASAIFDINQTKVHGNLVKVMAWYDNEWGFSNRMLDSTIALCSA